MRLKRITVTDGSLLEPGRAPFPVLSLRFAPVLAGWLLGSVCGAPPSLYASQARFPIVDEPCEACFLRVDTVAVLDRAGPVPLSDQVRIVATSNGDLVVQDRVRSRDELLRFDRSGQHLGTISLEGVPRPGLPLADPEGWIIVPDRVTGDLYRIRDDGVILPPIPAVDGPVAFTFLPDGRLVVNAHSRSTARSRYALHVVASGDGAVRSFDRYDGRILTAVQSILLRRELATDGQGRVWSFHVPQYHVDQWEVDAATVRRFERRVPWFETLLTVPGPARLYPPPGAIRGVDFDPGTNLLWVVIGVAAEDWRGYELPPNDGMGRGPDGEYVGMNRHLHNQVYDTVVEVVDPDRPAVVLTHRLPVELSSFIGRGHVVAYHGTSNDHGTYYILRLSLGMGHGPGSEGPTG